MYAIEIPPHASVYTAAAPPGARLLAAADGANPLFAGVEGGNLEVLQLLLDAGCVLNPRDQE
jgi:hypothetical protein